MPAFENLPPVSGRVGVAVRAFMIALLALTAMLLAAGGWMAGKDHFVTVPNNLSFGFMTGSGSRAFPDSDQVRIYTATSPAARRSGIKPDDVILSIQGEPVPPNATELRIGDMMGAVRGPVATVVTRSVDGTVRSHRLPREADAWSAPVADTGLSGWQRSAFLFGTDQLRQLFLFTCALLLFLRRPRDPVALLFAAAFLLYCHGGANSAFWFWHSLGLADIRPWMAVAVYPLIIVALNAFPDGRLASRMSRLTVLGGVPLFVSLVLIQRFWQPLPAASSGYALLALLLASAGGLLLRYRRLASGPERQQVKWAVTGFAGFVLLTAAVMIPSLLGLFQGPAGFIGRVTLSTAAALVLPLGLLVSLLRYRLYDADAAISRSASYSFLTVLLVTAFAAAKQGLELFSQLWFDGVASIASSGIAAAAAAMLITPMHNRVVRWSDARFQKPLTRMRRELPELVGDLRETAQTGEIAATVIERVQAGVRATRAAIELDGKVVAARGGEGERPVRIELRQEEDGPSVGALLLGPRPDGSLYRREERAALAEVAGPVGRALRIVSAREADARARATEMAELKDRLRLLEEKLGTPRPPRLEVEPVKMAPQPQVRRRKR